MNKSISVSFQELGIVACHSGNKRKMIKPIYVKLNYKTIPVLYLMGYVFRNANNPKEYYTMEQLRELFKKKYNLN